MRHLSAILWIVPLAVHIGYLCFGFDGLPENLGKERGLRSDLFAVVWLAVIGVANLVFCWMHVVLPRLGDRWLSVPGKDYWLADAERRAELVERLRGLAETALFCLNVFFLGVYQFIYQANAAKPLLVFPGPVLFLGFMTSPIVLAAIATVVTALALTRGASAGKRE